MINTNKIVDGFVVVSFIHNNRKYYSRVEINPNRDYIGAILTENENEGIYHLNLIFSTKNHKTVHVLVMPYSLNIDEHLDKMFNYWLVAEFMIESDKPMLVCNDISDVYQNYDENVSVPIPLEYFYLIEELGLNVLVVKEMY